MPVITVLSPVGELRAGSLAVPALPASLRGLTVGFLDNTKSNFDRLVEVKRKYDPDNLFRVNRNIDPQA